MKVKTEKATYYIEKIAYRTWRLEVEDADCEIHLVDICPSKQSALDRIKWEEGRW